jgi:peptidoglycan/xylan/chitin deacetylase (PgdA/CDA1 family)
MYHSISDETETGQPYYWINTSPALFAQHMQYLADHDYQVIPLSTAVQMIRENSKLQTPNSNRVPSQSASKQSTNNPSPLAHQRQVVLTFDDGYADFYTHAFPILKQYGFTATVFLPTAFIGNGEQGLRGKPHLTWEQVRELQAAGLTFGSHTVNHPQLYDLNREEMELELRHSKETIEARINESTWSPSAFPTGSPNRTKPLRENWQSCSRRTDTRTG